MMRTMWRWGVRFNPLHCGAVVASVIFADEAEIDHFVSIPFIAGQWSLPPSPPKGGRSVCVFQSPSLRGSGRFRRHVRHDAPVPLPGFNPLHCGAVVASRDRGNGARRRRQFQSPSLRGSGRFPRPPKADGGPGGGCFNPLHCGAVVASKLEKIRFDAEALVSIPFIAGQWSLHVLRDLGSGLVEIVSIPFIAGQWSLQRRAATQSGEQRAFQSPSLRGSGRFKTDKEK